MVDNNVRTPVAQQLNNAFGQVNAAGAQGKGTQKAKGIDLSKLAELMVAYKLGDNFSMFKAHEFIMEPVIRERFGLDEFSAKTLYRAVERLGKNRERIVSAFKQRVRKRCSGQRLLKDSVVIHLQLLIVHNTVAYL